MAGIQWTDDQTSFFIRQNNLFLWCKQLVFIQWRFQYFQKLYSYWLIWYQPIKLDIWPIRIEYLYHCKNRSISQTAMKWPNFLLLIYLYTQMNHLIWVIKMWFIQIWVIYESHLKWPKLTFNDMNKYFVQIKHTKIILLLFLLNTDSLSLWWPSMCPVNPTRCPRFYDLAPGQFSNQTIMIFKQSLGVLSQ